MGGMMISQLREFLAQIQDSEGDIEVRIPAMLDADREEDDTVTIEGVAFVREGERAHLVIADAYTLEGLGS